MKINLLELHDPAEDTTPKKWIRAYTVLPKYCKKPDCRNAAAVEVVRLLQKAASFAEEEYGRKWVKIWIEKIGYELKEETVLDWIRGRSSTPLIAIDALSKICGNTETEDMMDKIPYVCSSTREVVHIPNQVSDDLLYIYGLIAGDGSMPYNFKDKEKRNRDYRLMMISGDKEFLEDVYSPLFQRLFHTHMTKPIYHNGAWVCIKGSKPICRFLTEILKLPCGKKSRKLRIPYFIKNGGAAAIIPFLSGLIDTDIGLHSRGLGATFASEGLVDDLIQSLDVLGIRAITYGVHYKNDKYAQYDFKIPKGEVSKLYKLLLPKYPPRRRERLQNIARLAGVSERSNELASGASG